MGAEVMIDRRALIAAGLAAGLATPLLASGLPPITPRTVRLPVGGRSTEMTVWTPAKVRGVALLSTGHGSWPARYDAIAQVMGYQGLATLAPMHVDSVEHPDRAAFSLQASFGERIADMTAAAAYAARAHPGLPVIAAGHSFGTLTSLCLAGGLAYAGSFRVPAVRAVLGFSSPGRIPGLIQPTAYGTVAAPLLLITGTADVVPGFVTDPADHLLAPQTSTGPAFALVTAGGDHALVAAGSRIFDRVRPVVDTFLRGYAGDDAEARKRLGGWKAAAGDRFIVRNAA